MSTGYSGRKRLRFLLRRMSADEKTRLLAKSSVVTFIPMEAVGEQGQLDVSGTRKLEEVRSGYSVFFDGDVVVAKITPCFENGKGAVIRNTISGVGFGTTELHVLTPGPDLDSRFLYYMTASPEFRRRGETMMAGAAGQQRVPEDFVRDFPVIAFPTDFQRAIADFLDRETGRIDALVAAKQRLLDLLAEKRKAIIASAVTRGLDPSVPMRSTGVEWMPEAPVHWRQSRIGRLFKQSKLLGFPDLTVLSVYREYGVIERSSRDDNANRLPDDLEKYQMVEPGDLVINKMKAWQGSLGVSDFRGITSPDYVVFRPVHLEEPAFLHFLLRTQQLTIVYLSMSNGIRTSQWRIEPDRFIGLPIFLPSLDEQRAIVEYITRETGKLDRVCAAAERTIALLKERRAALIAAAVTGQIDVGAAA